MHPVRFAISDLRAARPGVTDEALAGLAMHQYPSGLDIAIDIDGEPWRVWWGEQPPHKPSAETLERWGAPVALPVLEPDEPGTRFFDTSVCKGQQNCELCRDPEKGRSWRKAQLKLYPVEGIRGTEFRCPYKKPWKYRTPRHGPLKLGEVQECVIIEHNQGLGDAVMLTAAIRDLQRQFPGRYNIGVRCHHRPEVFWHNPYIEGGHGGAKPKVIKVECWAGTHCNDTGHFLHHFHRKLGDALGVQIRPGKLGGDIHLASHEKSDPPRIDRPYWLLFSRMMGGSTKWYDIADYQKVVDLLAGKVHFVQVGRYDAAHQNLRGATVLAGQTGLRELIQLVYHADGVVSPISAGMHLAAAVPCKPGMPNPRHAVVVAGGREPAAFISYPNHAFLSAVGQLLCCAKGGCFRYETGPTGDCLAWHAQPSGFNIADCMKLPALAPERVAEAVLAHQATVDEHKCRYADELERQRQDYLARTMEADGNVGTCLICPQFVRRESPLFVICSKGPRSCGCRDGGRVQLAPFKCPLGKGEQRAETAEIGA